MNNKLTRLIGLDLARYLALIGMVIVNFNVVMVNPQYSTDHGVADFLQGKAAALFVVLAGIGFGLSANHKSSTFLIKITTKRFIFLLVLGLINSSIFQADIIHFYAFYFLFGLWVIPLSSRVIIGLIIGLIVSAVVMVVVLNYDQGWDWANYHYEDFWTFTGFFRNLFFNGWHPVIPWLAFLLLGMLLARTDLSRQAVQWNMLIIGGALFVTSTLLANWLVSEMGAVDQDLVLLLSTSPIPPMPLYMLAAGGLAVSIIGICLMASESLSKTGMIQFLSPAGRQSLTWYLLHILLGMGWLEASDQLSTETESQALFVACIFCSMATVVAFVWQLKFKRGPVETLMRKLCR